MNKKIELSEMELNRINELRLRTLIFKMLKVTNNNFVFVKEYIKGLNKFLDFDLQIITDVIQEIIKDRYAPTTDEIIKINLLLGHTIPEIAEILKMNISTVKMHIYRNDNNINTMILYPRLKQEQLQAIRQFLKLYNAFYVPTNKIFRT